MGNPLPWLLVVVRYAVKPVEAKHTKSCVEPWLGCGTYLATAHEHFNSKSASEQLRKQASKNQSAIKFGSAGGECGTYR